MRRTQTCPQCGSPRLPKEIQGLCANCLRRMLALTEVYGAKANPLGRPPAQKAAKKGAFIFADPRFL